MRSGNSESLLVGKKRRCTYDENAGAFWQVYWFGRAVVGASLAIPKSEFFYIRL